MAPLGKFYEKLKNWTLSCTDLVSHDAEFVKRRLSVEQHNISIHQMALHDITTLKGEKNDLWVRYRHYTSYEPNRIRI